MCDLSLGLEVLPLPLEEFVSPSPSLLLKLLCPPLPVLGPRPLIDVLLYEACSKLVELIILFIHCSCEHNELINPSTMRVKISFPSSIAATT